MIPKEILARLNTAGEPAWVICVDSPLGLMLAHYPNMLDARLDFHRLAQEADPAFTLLALLHLDAAVDVTLVETYTRTIPTPDSTARSHNAQARRN